MALNILLVDESQSINKAFQVALQDFNPVIHQQFNPISILGLMEEQNPDMVFVNVLANANDGYGFSESIKTHEQFKDIPVIIIHNSFITLDEGKCKSSQANGFLEKPFDSNTLRSLVLRSLPRLSENPISKDLDFDDVPLPLKKEQGTILAETENNLKSLDPTEEAEETLSFLAKEEDILKSSEKAEETLEKNEEALNFEESKETEETLNFEEPKEAEETLNFEEPKEAEETLNFESSEEEKPQTSQELNKALDEVEEKDINFKEENIIDFSQNANQQPHTDGATAKQLNELPIQEWVKEATEQMIKEHVHKIVPEVAKLCIKEELDKLLAERDEL